MNDDFTPLTVPQLTNHCAPTSLSYCLYMLGIEATQRELAHAAGVPWRVYRAGLNEKETRRAANAYGVTARFLEVSNKQQGSGFAAKLRRHLRQGHPAMLCCMDFGHWISVLGYADHKFIIADPDDDDQAFSKWTERTLLRNGWNDDGDDDEETPPQYFAILLKRRDGKPTRWNLTEEWLRLCRRGSEEALDLLAEDIAEVACRAGGTREGKRQIDLATVLREYEHMIPEQVAHWVEAEVSVKDLRDLYRDFRVTAESLRLRVPRSIDHGILITQMTTLLSTWSWTDQL